MPITYKFDNFPYVDSMIIIPKETIMYRGISKQVLNVIRDYPMYLGSADVAKMYGDIYTFQTTKELRLLDLRKISSMLPVILNTKQYDISQSDILTEIQYLIMGLGFTSYNVQYSLLSEMTRRQLINMKDDQVKQHLVSCIQRMQQSPLLNSPMDIARGVRIGEIVINGHVVLTLKNLFSGICDGYIAPILESPYHTNGYVHEEIVVFSPKDNLQLLTNPIDVTTKNITSLFQDYKMFLFNYKGINTEIYMKAGGKSDMLYDRNMFFIKHKEESKMAKKNSKRLVKFLKSNKKKEIVHLNTFPIHNIAMFTNIE